MAGRIEQKYVSWDNVKFDTFGDAQRYCTNRHIQMPHNALRQLDVEVSTQVNVCCIPQPSLCHKSYKFSLRDCSAAGR